MKKQSSAELVDKVKETSGPSPRIRQVPHNSRSSRWPKHAENTGHLREGNTEGQPEESGPKLHCETNRLDGGNPSELASVHLCLTRVSDHGRRCKVLR